MTRTKKNKEELSVETPVEETPVEETPVEETPVEETPVEETPDTVTDTEFIFGTKQTPEVRVLDEKGIVIRVYDLHEHGKGYKQLAEQFVSDRSGYSIK